MLTATEKKNLKKLLLSGNPDTAFSYDELLGYLFGLAMTPELIMPSEWMPVIFGGELPEVPSIDHMQTMTGSLLQVYNRFTADFHACRLDFPFNLERVTERQFESLYEWVSGFEEAIALREDLWDPMEFPELPEHKQEELYHSMMTIQGLVDPSGVMEYFEKMPDEVFREAFSNAEDQPVDRELQVQALLLASLPLAVETLQAHARTLEGRRQRRVAKAGAPVPLRPVKGTDSGDQPKAKSAKGRAKAGGKPDSAASGGTKKSNVIKVDFPQHRTRKSPLPPVYQLKIALQDAKPPIWRRVQVPGDLTLERLHEVIQICMGWTDSHLHQFLIDRTCYCLPNDEDLWQASRPKNEAKYTLHDLERKIQPAFQYIYDFGDDWIHQITVEKVLPSPTDRYPPLLLTGRRACPPEDVGGIHGYMHLLEVLQDPDDEEYEEMTEWLGVDFFDPSQFGKEDVAAINATLEELFARTRR